MMALRRRRQAAERKASASPCPEDGSEDGIKATWIELNFRKRECVKFVPSFTHEGFRRCGCGRLLSSHLFLDSYKQRDSFAGNVPIKTEVELQNETVFTQRQNSQATSPFSNASSPLYVMGASSPKTHNQKKRAFSEPQGTGQCDSKWNVTHHTTALPTDAFGTLEYQGTGEGVKSQYIRLAHDTHPELVQRLLSEEWGLQRPKMVITVHGGVHNFQLQPKLRRVFCDGLIKAAKTTGAWIMLFGLNTGVGSIVGDALKEHKTKSRGKIYSIGVAPWGVVDNREDLIDTQAISSYQTMANPLSKGAVLNSANTHFLLVDNGTEGKYGSELKFRRRLERKLSLLQINPKHSRRVPVVCLVLEGGKNTINVVLENVRQNPPIPVIVVDGSGRAADLLAFAHQYAEDDGTMMEELRLQLLITIRTTFACSKEQAQFIFLTIMECVRRKELITVFRLGQGQNKHNDIDNAILTASLRARRTSAPDMLSLALTWNRIDIAKSQIFVYGQHWPVLSLEQAMMDALTQDRMEFVKLLMENGVSMHKFLTIPRLEELYNIKQIPVHLLYLLQDVKKNITLGCRFNLIEIGQVIESLMGGAYRCNYTRKRFRLYYATQAKTSFRKQSSFSKSMLPSSLPKLDITTSFTSPPSTKTEMENSKNSTNPQCQIPKDFQYPFHELMVWAVLMKRQKMALFMWQHGEEAIAKALVAAELYRAMAREAADDELDLEEMEDLRRYSSEFRDLATQLLETMYRADTDAAQHLLTYELKQWSKHTCLSLAIAAQHRDFIAHPCVQLLLNDLWMGGLNVRKNSSLRVILGLLFPPSLYMLQFKSQEELKLMPQTMEEHMDERNDSSSISSSSSSSLSSSTSSSSSSSSSTSGSITSGFQPKPEVVGRGVTGLDDTNKPPEDTYLVFMAQHRQLPLSKKIYEFYNAPITKFWLYTISYCAFLVMFTYVVLVSMDNLPSPIEWVVISYIFTLALEKIREICASEPSGGFYKIKLWLGHFWHRADLVLLLTFFSGFALRMVQDAYLLKIGRTLYCVNVTLWYIRLLNIFSVSKYLGPYVMMMGKMMVDLGTFIILLAVVLISFGVTRQAILHPNEVPKWSLIQNVLMEPYFMLYGEVYAGNIDPCNSDNSTELCVVGSWIVPTAMTLYLLVANILLLNMLIAVFNNTFTKVKNISDKIWKFHRYGMIVENEFRPTLPPPFILISYVVMLIRLCLKRRKNSLFNSDRGLKLFLCDEDVEKLHDFEEDCLNDLFRRKDPIMDKNAASQMQTISTERLDKFLDYIDESGEHGQLVTSQLHNLEERLSQLEETNLKILNILPQLADGQLNSSEISQTEYTSDDTSFAAMRERMRFKLKRIRLDSEMSTVSDWHPPNALLQRLNSQKTRTRHQSERIVPGSATDYKIRKTHSVGNIGENKLEQQASMTSIAAASSHNSGYPDLRAFTEQEQKSVSCQDLLMLKEMRKTSHEDEPAMKFADSVVSGSEFLPSDYYDDNTPGETGGSSFFKTNTLQSDQKPKIRFKNELLKVQSYEKNDNFSKALNGMQELSGNERSCSSMSDSDHGTSRPQRKKRTKVSDRSARKAALPTLIINSPESQRLVKKPGFAQIDDINSNLSKEKPPRLKREHFSFPLLHLSNDDGRTPRRMTAGPGTSLSGRRKLSNAHNMFSPQNQSMYKSITDCIDTSLWHDSKMPATSQVPQTPFEMWTNKPPDFNTRQNRSAGYQVDGISLDEWEDEPTISLHRHSSKSTNRSHKHRRHRRSRIYSNNSSSSIKSVSSLRRRRSDVRKHRNKRKKKLSKGLLEMEDENNGLPIKEKSSDCQSKLSTLKENATFYHQNSNNSKVFLESPTNSAAPVFNINNCGLIRCKTDSNLRSTQDADLDSFLVRYSHIRDENLSKDQKNASELYDAGMATEKSPLL